MRDGEEISKTPSFVNYRGMGAKTYVVYVTMKRYVISDRVRARANAAGVIALENRRCHERDVADRLPIAVLARPETRICGHLLGTRFMPAGRHVLFNGFELTYRNGATRFARCPLLQLPNSLAGALTLRVARKRTLIKTRPYANIVESAPSGRNDFLTRGRK